MPLTKAKITIMKDLVIIARICFEASRTFSEFWEDPKGISEAFYAQHKGWY